MKEISDQKSFAESFLKIIPALKNEEWQLLNSDLTTPLSHIPSMPLTNLQKQWLKAISLDSRIKLFDVDFDFLKDTEPLFTPDDYTVFDKYSDGDPFEDENYIKVFKTVLSAVKNNKKIKAEYESLKGNRMTVTCTPFEIEYSEKDDKFRVNIAGCQYAKTFNIACIKNCEIIGEGYAGIKPTLSHSDEFFIAELIDYRKALERFMHNFAHFQKEAEHIGENRYRIKVFYDKSDETELLIRVLSFGPMVKITEPSRFVNLIKERLVMQKSCGLK